MATHRVYYGKGDQTLTTVPQKNGVPVRVASATYTITDSRYGLGGADKILVPAGTVATVDAVSTTLTNKAGSNAADHRAISVVSTAGISAHHSYLLTSPDGRVESVRIAAVAGATDLLTAAEIRGQFPTGSTLRGVEVAASFPASAADDDKNLDGEPWLITWQFAGFTPIRQSIWLERAEEGQLATLDDLKELDPQIGLMGGDRIDAALALSRAHKTFRNDLMLSGANESDLITGPLGTEAVVNLAAFYCYRTNSEETAQKNAEWYKERYNEIRAALQAGALKPQVVNVAKVDEAAETRNPAKLFRANGFM